MAVSGVGGNSGSNAPSTTNSEMSEFRNSLKGKTNEELRGMLDDPKLTSDQRKAVIDEIVSRPGTGVKQAAGSESPESLAGAGGAGGSSEMYDQLFALLRKLGDGSISSADLDKLKELLKKLGFTDQEINSMLKNAPGNGSGTELGGSGVSGNGGAGGGGGAGADMI